MIGLPVHGLAATRCTARTVSGACSSAACVTAHSSACCDSAEPSTLTTIPGTWLPAPSARAALDGQPLSAKRRAGRRTFDLYQLHALNRTSRGASMHEHPDRTRAIPCTVTAVKEEGSMIRHMPRMMVAG